MYELAPARLGDGLGEERAHRCAHGFDGEGIDAIVDQDEAASADRVAGAQYGAKIAGIAERLGDDPDVGLASVELCQGGEAVAIDADHGLGIILAGNLRKNVRRGFDDVAARCLHRRDQVCGEGMCGPGVEQHFRQHAFLARFGEDA